MVILLLADGAELPPQLVITSANSIVTVRKMTRLFLNCDGNMGCFPPVHVLIRGSDDYETLRILPRYFVGLSPRHWEPRMVLHNNHAPLALMLFQKQLPG